MKPIKHLVAAAAVSVFGASAAHAETLTVETGNASGMTNLVMQVIATYGGMDLQINSGSTLSKSCLKLAQGKIDAAVCPPTAHTAMMKGVGPFKKNPVVAKENAPKLRGLFAFSGGFFHPIVRADSAIETWADIEGQRVFTGPPAGSANSQSVAIISAASGFKAGEDYESVRLGWGAALQAFQDGQFDVMMYPSPIGNSAIEQLGNIRMLGLSEENLKTEAWIKYSKAESRDVGVIPAGVYSNVATDSEIMTAEYTMQAMVNENTDEEIAYQMTKLFWESLPEAKKNIKVMEPVNPETPFKGMSAKLHPGAARYYKEIGMDIPADKM